MIDEKFREITDALLRDLGDDFFLNTSHDKSYIVYHIINRNKLPPNNRSITISNIALNPENLPKTMNFSLDTWDFERAIKWITYCNLPEEDEAEKEVLDAMAAAPLLANRKIVSEIAMDVVFCETFDAKFGGILKI